MGLLDNNKKFYKVSSADTRALKKALKEDENATITCCDSKYHIVATINANGFVNTLMPCEVIVPEINESAYRLNMKEYETILKDGSLKTTKGGLDYTFILEDGVIKGFVDLSNFEIVLQ